MRFTLAGTSLCIARAAGRENKAILNYRKIVSFPVLGYPLLAAIIWGAVDMTFAFAFSVGLLAYVDALNHQGTAKACNRKFFCNMKSKRSPDMVGFFERYRTAFGRISAKK